MAPVLWAMEETVTTLEDRDVWLHWRFFTLQQAPPSEAARACWWAGRVQGGSSQTAARALPCSWRGDRSNMMCADEKYNAADLVSGQAIRPALLSRTSTLEGEEAHQCFATKPIIVQFWSWLLSLQDFINTTGMMNTIPCQLLKKRVCTFSNTGKRGEVELPHLGAGTNLLATC